MHKNGGGGRWICITQMDGERTVCYSGKPGAARLKPNGKAAAPPPVFKRELRETQAFIYTSAQNNTRVHAGFLASLRHCVRKFEAELIVVPYLYRNPTSPREALSDAPWWDPLLVPYLWNVRHKVNKNLVCVADIPMQPTATEPLSGLEGMTGRESTIVGHPKLDLKTVATPGSKMAKLMTTTGACTVDTNYSKSKAGKKGEFHHTLGAVLVIVKGDQFWLFHLLANKNGEFTHLRDRFTPRGARRAPRPAAFVLGDAHVRTHDKAVDAARFGANGVVPYLKPRKLIWHDVDDGATHNPHERKDVFNRVARHHGKQDNIRAEVMESAKFVGDRTDKNCESIVVSSNHDDFLTRHIRDMDWKDDPENAEFYLETALAMVRGAKMSYEGAVYPSAFAYWLKRLKLPRVRVLGGDEHYSAAGILLSLHGHKGPNGSRGSPRNLRRIGVKGVSGHNHTPTITEGWWSAGTGSILNPTYVQGAPSSWLQADVVVHADGKRQFIFYVLGEWK